MQFQHVFTVNSNQDKVYDVLGSPEQIYSCIPGCEKMESKGNDSFSAILKVGISFLSATFALDIKVTERSPPSRMKASIMGMDKHIGSGVDGRTEVELRPLSPNTTEVRILMDVVTSGKVAAFGQRVMGGVAEKKFEQFVACLKSRVEA